MWSVLEVIWRCRWEERHSPWAGTDVAELGYDKEKLLAIIETLTK